MTTKTEAIRTLNDELRQNLSAGTALITAGVAALGAEAVARIVKTIAIYDDFCHANDPHEEHDFGVFEVDGHKIFFKIDYFDNSRISALAGSLGPFGHRARDYDYVCRGVLTADPQLIAASKILERAAKDEAAAIARIATLNEQIAAHEPERAALTFDEALLARAEDIAQLRDRRIQVRAGKADLPKRRAELAAAEAMLKRLAGELEWNGGVDQLIAQIPAKAKIAALRGLLNRRGAQCGAVENAEKAVAEAEEKLAEIATEIETLGPATDVSKLAMVIKAAREVGDFAGQIANSRREEQEARTAIGRALKTMRPAVDDPAVLELMAIPALASVEAHRDCLSQSGTAATDLSRTHSQCGTRAHPPPESA